MYQIKKTIALVVLLVTLLPISTQAKGQTEVPEAWLVWLEDLKEEMIARGISKKTINKAYGENTYYHEQPEVVKQDKNQAEFVLTCKNYLNRMITPQRVKLSRQYYHELQEKYPNLEDEYQVPLNYLTAFWALETNFGQNKGKYHIIVGLTNLSYNNRRSAFFKNELYNVLKIMEKYNLDNDKMMGSWAGAMGHFQFMPSTYNAYAVDYDKDGMIDIWDNLDDAIASAANYLNTLGWKYDEPWGGEVRLPWSFDYRLAGRNVSKTVDEWQNIGVLTADGKKLPYPDNLKASIIIPDGHKGSAYIVFGNFKRIMIWNRSENYALAISILADYIGNDEKYESVEANQQYVLTDKEVRKVQAFANKILKTGLKEDGILGTQTKEAVKRLQAKAHLHQDGYPDYRLLNKINNYDSEIGFAVPVQPRKKLK